MRRLVGCVLATMVLSVVAARATPSELQGLVTADRPAGCSKYSYLFWDFYRAELWTDEADLPGGAFGLSLTYLSDFSRDELIKSSVDEMVRISGLPEGSFVEAQREMQQTFRDVEPGDRITAWRVDEKELRLFVNGQETGALTNHVDMFLAIWLGDETRHPKGREALLAGHCDD